MSAWVMKTPWKAFQDRSLALDPAKWKSFLKIIPDTMQSLICSKRPTNDDLYHPAENLVFSKSRTFLPNTHASDTPDSLNHALDSRLGMMGDQILISLAGTISNNFDTYKTTPIIVELARNREFRAVFRDLLACGLDTMGALGEKLFIPAVRHDNLELVRLLIDSKVDINLRAVNEEGDEKVTALQCAIQENCPRMVRYLLERGATDWDVRFLQGSVLDLAVDANNHEILSQLIEHASTRDLPQATMRTVHRAVLLGQIADVKLMLQTQSELLDAARANPWFLYEAAAAGKPEYCDEMVEFLIENGLDINATDHRGRGSMLAAASKTPNMRLIHQRLAAYDDVNKSAVGLDQLSDTSQCQIGHSWRLGGIRGKTPLHIAIRCGHEALAKLLLSHEANINQACNLLLPIQVAAWKGQVEIIEMLSCWSERQLGGSSWRITSPETEEQEQEQEQRAVSRRFSHPDSDK